MIKAAARAGLGNEGSEFLLCAARHTELAQIAGAADVLPPPVDAVAAIDLPCGRADPREGGSAVRE